MKCLHKRKRKYIQFKIWILLQLVIFNIIVFIAALLETRDINLYLKPLEYNFKEVESCEFKDLGSKVKALLHCACLMWANSKYYSLERMIALLQEISNLVISQHVSSIHTLNVRRAYIR
ncbi:dynein beta chain, ciliary-like [Halictus rubicundus]|uniref:dynein beta chain, ciliary-like n=1 Tax=Halictus rubicundus TaxID=77578 RepID=UPI004035F3F6